MDIASTVFLEVRPNRFADVGRRRSRLGVVACPDRQPFSSRVVAVPEAAGKPLDLCRPEAGYFAHPPVARIGRTADA